MNSEMMNKFFDEVQEAMSRKGYTLAHVRRQDGEDFYTIFDSEGNTVMQTVPISEISDTTLPGIERGMPLDDYKCSYPDDVIILDQIEQLNGYDVIFAFDPAAKRFPILICYRGVVTAFRTLQDALFCYRLHYGVQTEGEELEESRASIRQKLVDAMVNAASHVKNKSEI